MQCTSEAAFSLAKKGLLEGFELLLKHLYDVLQCCLVRELTRFWNRPNLSIYLCVCVCVGVLMQKNPRTLIYRAIK